MSSIIRKIRNGFRGLYRLSRALFGFVYDFKRLISYGGWKENLKDASVRGYNLMMCYHGLEKSLSYKNRNPNSGWSNAEKVFYRLNVAVKYGSIDYHDRAAKSVLVKFLSLPENRDTPRAVDMLKKLELIPFELDDGHGTMNLSRKDLGRGILPDPEAFFWSRFTVREFSNLEVSEELVNRAINLAMKTPSVCNRHAWHVYKSGKREIIDAALKYQNGNKPFGQGIPYLLIISVDLKAFFAGAEHYQHWIDGGLFSMSLIYAFHSLGLVTCPLNWCQNPSIDKSFRRKINISDSHTIIMFLGVGHPSKENKVCSSKRRPVENIYSEITLK